MNQLVESEGLLIRQKKDWSEIVISWERANRYLVTDTTGKELYQAAEVGGSVILRQLLRMMRPFTVEVRDFAGQLVFTVRRPWRWYFHEVVVSDANGEALGTVRRRFSWLRRCYNVLDPNGQQCFELLGPILRPWTFLVRRDGIELGAIRKKWSGLLKEAFTGADNFGIAWPREMHECEKAILLGAVFLIDFLHFENNNYQAAGLDG